MSKGRGYLTQRERAAVLAAQGGRCIVSGCTETVGLIGEHTVPNAFIAGKPDALMCVRHHREKTARDVKDIARAKRRAGEHGQQARRARRKAEGKRPLLPTKPLEAGRGFDKTMTRGFDGKVQRRKP